jgi:murein DD-endopeptidase MepM/ murein hydrolase activator NlpD
MSTPLRAKIGLRQENFRVADAFFNATTSCRTSCTEYYESSLSLDRVPVGPRRTGEQVFRSRLAIALVASVFTVIATATQLAAPSATADTASDLAAARQKVADAQAEANAVAAEMSAAQGRYEALDAQINQLQDVIDAAKARVSELEQIVRERAVAAYAHRDTNTLGVMLESDSPLEGARRAKLLDQANQTDNVSVKKLAALKDDVAKKQKEVQAQREEQQNVKQRLDAKNAQVQDSLAAANKARDELAARLEKEQADAAAAAELARIRAIQAANQIASQSSAGTGNSGGGGGGSSIPPGQVIANPGGGAFQCPLTGSAYSDSYGPRGDGFHYGIDMMAPTGAPEVAVKAGSVSYIPMGGAGGNEAYLAADDGNVYYYAHMSQFVGGARRVSQGEVIGLVGSTGSSTAPHLHFEIRIGGANGQRIDPYPTLQAAGC